MMVWVVRRVWSQRCCDARHTDIQGNQPPRPGVLLRRDKLPCQSAGPYADRKWQFIPSFAERDYVIS